MKNNNLMIEALLMVIISIGLSAIIAFFTGAFIAGLLIVIGISSNIAIGTGLGITIVLWIVTMPEMLGKFSEID